MANEWLSESISDGAKSVILLGPLSNDLLIEHSSLFPLGILWFAPVDTKEIHLPKNVKLVKINKGFKFLKEALSEFILLDYNSPPSVKVSKEVSDNRLPIFTKILDLVIAEIDTTMRARRTRNETGYIRQRQIFSNFAGYLQNRVPKEWCTLGQGVLGIVVGAGPSLDITLPIIKKDIPRPIIVATDSSLRALMKIGLEPDFVISIDPKKTFQSCSEPGYTPGIAVLSTQSHESWLYNWKERCCFLSGRVLTEDWLAEKGISKTKILAVNNAGLTALAFADFLNTSALLAVGMDLASSDIGNQRYAETTGRSHMQVFASHYHKVPGNYKDFVLTPFLSDWQETSDQASEISKRKTLINLNDRGAKLEGTSLVHPNQFEDLKEVLNENFLPFSLKSDSILKKRKALNGHGMYQLLCQLTSFCDNTWSSIPNQNKIEDKVTFKFLKDLMSNKDIASLLGDFAFTIIPKLSEEKKPTIHELENAILNLKELIWKLEDAILDCTPNDEFTIRFLTEKFN